MDELLCATAKTDKCDITEILVKGGANVNYIDQQNKTPLYYAYENKMFEQMKMLLSYGAQINQLFTGKTILQIECSKMTPDLSMIDFLMDNCANPNIASKKYQSALMSLTMKNEIDCIQILLSYPQTNVEATAFRYACINHRNCMAVILLQKGADPNTQGFDGRSTLMRCITEKNFGMASILISRNDIKLDLQDDGGNTALHLACMNTSLNEAIVYQLLFCGADKTIKNKKGELASECCYGPFDWIFEAHEQLNKKVDVQLIPDEKKQSLITTIYKKPCFCLTYQTISGVKQGFVGTHYQTWNIFFDCWNDFEALPQNAYGNITCEYVDRKVPHHIVRDKGILIRFNFIRKEDGSIINDLYE